MKEYNNKSIPISELRDAICNDFQKHDYEWFCTLKLPTYNVETAEKYLKKWRTKMSTQDKIQIAYKGLIVLSSDKGPHIHLLMFGKNKHGQTLHDKDENDWKKAWGSVTHKDAVIEKVYDLEKAAEYMSLPRNTPIDHFEQLIPYNIKLLNKKNSPYKL